MDFPRGRYAVALGGLAALALTLAFFHLGAIGLLDPDEARYAQTSREMMQRGDWVVPYYNGEPRLKKPPLYHWENLATYEAFGVNEFAARLPSALAFLALVTLTVAWGRRESGWGSALRAGAILATSPLAFVAGRMVLLDMTLSVWTTCALLVFWQADRGRLRPLPAAAGVGVCVGIAILAKGPVGILIPALIIIAFLLQQGEWRRLLRWPEALTAFGVAAAVSLPWLALVIHRIGAKTFWAVAFRETVERYAETGLEHPEPLWFYLAVFALAAFPWSAFLLTPFLAGIRRYILPNTTRVDRERARLASFLWVWIVVTLAFFSIGRGKLPTYILPLMPAAALYLSLEWERWSRPEETQRPAQHRAARLEWVLALILFLPAFGLTWLVVHMDPVHSAAFMDYRKPFLLMGTVVVIGTIALSPVRRRWAVVPLLAVSLAVFYLYAVAEAGGRLEQARSLRALVRDAGLNRQPPPRVIVYRDYHPSLIFYTNRRVERADGKDALAELLSEPGETVVIMDTDRLAALPAWISVRLEPIAAQDRQIALRRIEPGTAAPATSATDP